MPDGGCFCGRCRYEAKAEPFHETVCHCADCRRIVGAAAVAWFTVPRDAFRWVGEEPAEIRSSAEVSRRFCPHCGTSLSYAHDGLPGEIDVTIASLDAPEAVPPKDHTRTAARLGWDEICDGRPAYPGLRDRR